MTTVYPNTAFQDLCHEAGMTATCLWEIPGPVGGGVAWITAYRTGNRVCLVTTYQNGGWDLFAPTDASIRPDAVGEYVAQIKSLAQ